MGEKSAKLNWKAIMMVTGAFISYTIGAGFASGNEVLQFFGSWGFPQLLSAVFGGILYTVIFCVCLYIVGQKVSFEKLSDSYAFFGGKILGNFFKGFVVIFILGCYMLMFAGAGSLGTQFLGLPQWVGAIALGVVTGVIVIGGLKTVENVLGWAGIVILGYLVIFGIVTLFNPGTDFSSSAGAAQAVADGKIWQANLFALPPLSSFPALASLNGPFIEGLSYGGICLLTGYPFYLALGKNMANRREAVIGGTVTAIGFYLCVAFVLIILMGNFFALVDPATDKMFPFPTLAAITSIWPSGAWTYCIIIFIGIFTTATGYLWVLTDMVLPGQERSKKAMIFIAVMLVIGIALGGVIPFSALINFMFPFAGVIGMVMIVALIIKTVQVVKQAE